MKRQNFITFAIIVSLCGAALTVKSATRRDSVNVMPDGFKDSLRQVLSNQKPNAVLKSSFLEELYIRGVVNPDGFQLKFEIHFDLHGYDCGAPDCYVNHFEFGFLWDKESVNFPDTLLILDRQTGCLEQKITKKTFIKQNENAANVIYYSEEHRQYLVLGSTSSHVGFALCFDDKPKDYMDLNNLKKRTQQPQKESDAPFRSLQTETIEYDLFIRS